MAVFPLGTVLLPTQVLPLHIFEERYRVLMEGLAEPGSAGEMGVVLIEAGSEVGGGERRTTTGTVARLVESKRLDDGRWLAVFGGSHRFRVVSWLPDDPFPQAEVEEIPDPDWDGADDDAFEAAETEVRRALGLAVRLGEAAVRPSFALTPDPARAVWELCTIAPLGPFDKQRLLEAPTHASRLRILREEAGDAVKVLAFRLGSG